MIIYLLFVFFGRPHQQPMAIDSFASEAKFCKAFLEYPKGDPDVEGWRVDFEHKTMERIECIAKPIEVQVIK